ncbi:MAG TPA: lipid-A-disaccharide synthase [Candidatus Binatia bacterium]
MKRQTSTTNQATAQGREIMLVVGEASGDIHGAGLVDALWKRDPTLKIFGVAGERLQQTRFETLFSVSRLTGMGLVELAGNFKNLWQAYRLLRRALRERRPSLVVLIDFPEFNLRLAKLARQLALPVLYYVSPQVWAWRRQRVRQIERWVDRMAVVFPFEVPFYRQHGVDVSFVGHPLLEDIHVNESRETVLGRLSLDPAKPTIALLPGSRRREVEYHLPVMLQAAARLQRESAVQFLCVRAATVDRAMIETELKRASVRIPIVEDNRYDAVNASDLAWVASGTATLEAALLLKPMIVVYRLAVLTYLIARWLVKVDHVAMVNLIADKRVVPELIQSEFNADRLIEESRLLLNDRERYRSVVDELSRLREKLGSPGAAERVADLAFSMMQQKPTLGTENL